jgi:SHS2 domain-containing protein
MSVDDARAQPLSERPAERRTVTYTLCDHTADVAVEATGADRSAVFAAVADGLAAASCDELSTYADDPAAGDRFSVTVRAERPEAALFDYLDQLIYERDVRGVLPIDNEATVREVDGEWVVEASARAIPLTGLEAREVKAVTYSEMALEETPDGWRAYVVFDV